MTALRVALDVMGGDRAPRAMLEGALLACSERFPQPIAVERVILVGRRPVIEAGLAELGGDPGFAIVHAEDVIEMHESPATALRAKRDSSIGACVRLVREANAGAVVGMGNTGAAVGAATLGLGTLPGVRRPGIAVTLRLTGKPLTLIDMGANLTPKPEHLLQYALMGEAYMRGCLDTPRPRVGLLNVGEEQSKGTDELREAHRLLSASTLDFAGNVEGGDIFEHKVDLVVTDGFTGNVVLKLLEQFASFLVGMVRGEMAKAGQELPVEVARSLRRHIDYSEYGGALLLGVAGIVVIGHGRSDAGAVASALNQAVTALDSDVNAGIVRGIEQAARPTG